MNPLKFLGTFFTGSGWRTGLGLGLFVAGPVIKGVTGLDEGGAASYDNLSYAMIGGGFLGKIIKGEIALPFVTKGQS